MSKNQDMMAQKINDLKKYIEKMPKTEDTNKLIEMGKWYYEIGIDTVLQTKCVGFAELKPDGEICILTAIDDQEIFDYLEPSQSDTLYEYKENAENRLNELLNELNETLNKNHLACSDEDDSEDDEDYGPLANGAI